MDVYKGLSNNAWGAPLARNEFKERISYDANGNILKYLRNGHNPAKLLMDSLSYKYYAGTNRLSHVRDNVAEAEYALPGYEDIDTQDANNYSYDSIGNLRADVTENITNISWSVYGKITAINYSNTANSSLKNVYYTYDASGNRISKRVEKYSSSGVINSVYTWYVRDASGNVMATYSSTANGSSNPSNLTLKERHVYGSSRLGILNISKDVRAAMPSYVLSSPYKSAFTRGNKAYELSNHLGNVLVTISDKKIGHTADGANIDYYDADQMWASDYYPFGATMPARSGGVAYRYGFNGKEKEKDGGGGSLQYDYGFRIYDPHLARFKSVDPLAKKYPYQSGYVYAENNPIRFIDIDGKGAGDPVSYVTPSGGLIKLPSQLNVTYLGNVGSMTIHNNVIEVKNPSVGGKEISFAPGAINTFTFNKEIYEAKFNTNTGKFVGFYSQANAKHHITETSNTLPEWNVFSPSKSSAHISALEAGAISLNPAKKNPYLMAAAIVSTIYATTLNSDENVTLNTAIVKASEDLSGFVGGILYSKKTGNQLMDNLPQTLTGLNALREEIKQRQTANEGKLTGDDQALLGNIVSQEKAIGARNKAKRKK